MLVFLQMTGMLCVCYSSTSVRGYVRYGTESAEHTTFIAGICQLRRSSHMNSIVEKVGLSSFIRLLATQVLRMSMTIY